MPVSKIIARHILELREIKRQKKEWASRETAMCATLMQSDEIFGKITVCDDDGVAVTAHVITPTVQRIDHLELLAQVGTEVYNTLLIKTFSNELLEDAVAKGVIAKEVLASCTNTEWKSTYIKITEANAPPPKLPVNGNRVKRSAAARKIKKAPTG